MLRPPLLLLLLLLLGPLAHAGATETLTLAAGCFWSVELAFQRVPGVLATRVGYTGGHTRRPAYKMVTTGTTGHAEAVEVEFDPSVVSYGTLLDLMFAIHDATTLNQQGNDMGTQYRSGIWFHSAAQQHEAQAAISRAEAALASGKMKGRGGRRVVTVVEPASTFWEAEDYHQRYLAKLGQDSTAGSLAPIQCYGNYGPVKDMAKPAIRAILRPPRRRRSSDDGGEEAEL